MAAYSFKNIQWDTTIKVNLLRVVIAGILWSVLSYVFYAFGAMRTPFGPHLWLIVFIWPIGYIFIIPTAIVAGWLHKLGVPLVGLFTFVPPIMVIPADPFVSYIHAT
jgi:hypothetical protein